MALAWPALWNGGRLGGEPVDRSRCHFLSVALPPNKQYINLKKKTLKLCFSLLCMKVF